MNVAEVFVNNKLAFRTTLFHRWYISIGSTEQSAVWKSFLWGLCPQHVIVFCSAEEKQDAGRILSIVQKHGIPLYKWIEWNPE